MVLIVDLNKNIVLFNSECENLSGRSFDFVNGKKITSLLIKKDDIEHVENNYNQLLSGQDMIKDEHTWVIGDDTEKIINWIHISVFNENQDVEFIVSTGVDVTEVRLTEKRLEYLAYFDTLTDLPNRAFLYDRLSYTLGHARQFNQMFALMILDIDGFKYVNDTFGHDLGDLLLKKAAIKLPLCIGELDMVAHVGGDEFIVIMPMVHKQEEAACIAESIIKNFTEPFYLDGHECFVGISIGICMYPSDGEDIDMLLKNADIALYKAKDAGRNSYKFYSSGMDVKAVRRITLETSLRKALERKELFLNYQPKVNLVTGQLTGVEALLRWNSHEHGIISPGEFIPLAEETGLIIPIGQWILETVCKWINNVNLKGHTDFSVAVNLSAQQFRSVNIVSSIADIIECNNISPRCLEVEITESMLMNDAELAIEILTLIKNMGIKISVDDFGTGYSSLSYLKKFPIDNLKIDRSFIMDIPKNPDDEAITRAIIAMSHSLKLRVIAEGVETKEQLKFLNGLRCDEAQGYLFSKPLTGEEIEKEFLKIR